MAKLLKLRRGTTSQHSSFTGAEGEVTVDTDKETLVVHDGSTAGGHPVAAEDMANVSSASIAGRLSNDSIATSKIAAGALPTDVTVADANISGNLTIANADVNSDAAIAGTKISPNFGSQGIQTTGNILVQDSTGNTNNRIKLGTSEDFQLYHNGSDSVIYDAGVGRLKLYSNGTGIDLRKDDGTEMLLANNGGSVDLYHAGSKKLETTGSGVTVTGGLTSNTLTLSSNAPSITFTDLNNNPDFEIHGNSGALTFYDATNTANRLIIQSDGTVDVQGNLDANGGLDVTGNITVSGTVDGVDVAALNTTVGNLSLSGSTLSNGTTATTQSQGDNSTKVATTAYTDTAVANLVDSSPGALNTLNELAAAINDDANFSTTVTNSIATKLPLSGGTVTGGLTLSNTGNDVLNFSGSTTNDSRGISFNGNSAITADSSDGYLRLNQLNEFTNGVYTPGVIRADGGINVDGATTINGDGTVVASKLTGALPAIDGSNLTGIVSFVSGMIILWSGAENAIPSGWVLCNGSNSTPDLRDRFVVGAGSAYSVGNTGGSSSVTLTVNQIPAHGHTIPRASGTETNFDQTGLRGGPGYYTNTAYWLTSYNTGGGQAHENRPPYYALCYIMKT